MGARVTRIFKNFNLENRVEREISREKPRPAPRHEGNVSPQADNADVSQKNEPLLSLLKSVYVESTDPAAAAAAAQTPVEVTVERRPLRFSLPGDPYGVVELKDVAKGKLTITEALKALGSHQHQPQTWTPEKIAQEYSLNLNDTKALLQFFIPFQIQIIPPKTENAKQIRAS
ncbi:NADH dehydrogenase [ubiquinone] 1 alpha subcomplex assembly factor 4 isoform X2 [Betta splendens]|uniref:NADH dehydrogenase [ubiquinone] 1 alpha subcomplex assembly factor 4 n=1 Tax=Betta splendens TaxID=158456 RepID=A0A6P7LVN3_BETSP|nr:NADH dehydrogenase [ubiquinone] 1 alpha subcomplex assembly factor 4 isoform X2 [Betta splendens]